MAFWTEDQIERAAINLRERTGINHQSFPDMITCVFKAKKIGLISGYLCLPKAEMEEEGAFDPESGILYLREDVFQGANRGVAFARFAVAHEFGHAALGHKRKRYRAADTAARTDVPKVIAGDERQANLFAAAFLAPAHLAPLGTEPTANTIARHFGVSLTAAEIRRPSLTRAYRVKHGIKRELPQEVKDFLASFDQRRNV